MLILYCTVSICRANVHKLSAFVEIWRRQLDAAAVFIALSACLNMHLASKPADDLLMIVSLLLFTPSAMLRSRPAKKQLCLSSLCFFTPFHWLIERLGELLSIYLLWLLFLQYVGTLVCSSLLIRVKCDVHTSQHTYTYTHELRIELCTEGVFFFFYE